MNSAGAQAHHGERYPAIWFGMAVLILAYPFLTIADLFQPVEIFGKNLYTALPALFFLVSALRIIFDVRNEIEQRSLFLFFFLPCTILGLLVFFLRSVLYDESRNILYIRFIVMVPLFIFVMRNVLRSAGRREKAAKLLLLAVAMQSLIGVVHQHFFPNINIRVDYDEDYPFALGYDFQRTREAGTLLSASQFASVIIAGLLVMTARAGVAKATSIPATFFMLMLFGYALALAGSRFPLVVGLILGLIIMRKLGRTYAGLAVTLVTVVAIGGVFVAAEPETFDSIRLYEDSGGRWDKLVLPVELLTSSVLDLIIGTPHDVVGSAESAGGYGISDNSYMLMALAFGLPFAAAWFILILVQLSAISARSEKRYILLYFFLYLGVVNSVLWEPWLFYFALAYICVVGEDLRDERASHGADPAPGRRLSIE